ncbi:hypothetical protein [Oryzicola mucosus]|uniref:Uncharacterized protein n=1 Tax=Oryzicola mucosus TaxID=2767425 RepID=A0A8J6Q500_9HYPH|nr:hypothetical protein [Oryzicola mucosus]MBD0416525.1 hypothetical protein [Oryzicola mucosus]
MAESFEYNLGALKIRRRVKKPEQSAFRKQIKRLREIETIIEARYGGLVPETDDADAFIRAAAFAINGHCWWLMHEASGHGGATGAVPDVETSLRGWCARFAPWSLPRAAEILRPILRDLVGRKYDLSAQAVALLLMVPFHERDRLELNTVGACDISPDIRKAIVANRKRKRDRERQRAKRMAEGRQNRASYEGGSLAKTQPWLAEGISRRTWYRRLGTSLSRVGIYNQVGDTLVSRPTVASIAPTPTPPTSFRSPIANINERDAWVEQNLPRIRGAM